MSIMKLPIEGLSIVEIIYFNRDGVIMENKIPDNYHRDIEVAVEFLKNEGCEAVFLFGSFVTGDFHESSDIDIGIKIK